MVELEEVGKEVKVVKVVEVKEEVGVVEVVVVKAVVVEAMEKEVVQKLKCLRLPPPDRIYFVNGYKFHTNT